ncbi:MAG: RHS repeat-associated core domain-containing protein, partial [Dysgonomonas sp.]|nr:RHS repeat-associated core domain-containing protein [Dysgonomonas sp.]
MTEVKDEDGNTSYEFKDKLGQVVLTRQINEGVNYDTYYVCNDFGNLCYVLPPLMGDNISQDNLNKYAYLYKYDERNRCIWKKLPGCEPVYYIYDKADRLILSQDGEQRAKEEWYLTLPDIFGRVVLTGMYLDNIPQDKYWEHFKDKIITGVYGLNFWGGYGLQINGVNYFPKRIKTYTINYYDNYDFLALPGFKNYNLEYKTSGIETDYLKRYGDNNPDNKYKHKGLLTGTQTVLLNGKEYDTSTIYTYAVMYYDNKKRLIQSKSTNHLNGMEEEYIAYNF